MAEAIQTINDLSSSTSAGCDTTEIEIPSQYLLSSAKSAVEHALTMVNSIEPTSEPTAIKNYSRSSNHSTENRIVTATSINLPPPKITLPSMSTFHALQEWEGYVVSIDEDSFEACLIDITAGNSYESEDAIIPLNEISEHDASNMELGSIFRWVIGHERSPQGTRKRVSRFVFLDLPRITEDDLRAGREWAKKILSAFNL